MTEPQYYAYQYEAAAKSSIAPKAPVPGTPSWVVGAAGDLNGDGNDSNFLTGGMLDAKTNQPITFTQISSNDPEE